VFVATELGICAQASAAAYFEHATAKVTRMTLRTWLAKWLETVQQEVSPRTYERYGEIVKNFLIPALGESCSNQAHAIPYSGGIQPMGKGRPPRWQVRRLVAAHAPLHPRHTQIRIDARR
jgi:hypothetical protein